MSTHVSKDLPVGKVNSVIGHSIHILTRILSSKQRTVSKGGLTVSYNHLRRETFSSVGTKSYKKRVGAT